MLEKAVSILSELETANVLGRLVVHNEETLDRLTADQHAADQYLRLASTFKGTVPQSGLDPHPNAYRRSTFRRPHPQHSQPLDPKFDSAYYNNGELH